MQYSRSLRWVSIIDSNRMVRFYDMIAEEEYGTPFLCGENVSRTREDGPRLTDDGQFFVYSTIGADGPDSVRCYRVHDGTVVWEREVDRKIQHLTLHPTRPWFAYTAYADGSGTTTVVDIDSLRELATLPTHNLLHWTLGGEYVFVERDTEFVFVAVRNGPDIRIAWKRPMNSFSDHRISEDGRTFLQHVYPDQSVGETAHKLYTYNIQTGECVDSLSVEVDSRMNRIVYSASAQRFLFYNDTAYMRAEFGSAPIRRAWQMKGRFERYFDRDLQRAKVLRQGAVSVFDLATGIQQWNAQDGGGIDGSERCVLPGNATHIVYTRQYSAGFRYIDHADPFSSFATVLPGTVMDVGTKALYGNIPIITSDSSFIQLNAAQRKWSTVLRLPFAEPRFVQTDVSNQTVYVASRSVVLAVRPRIGRVDTMHIAPVGYAIIGGAFAESTREFYLEVADTVAKTISMIRVPESGERFQTDVIFDHVATKLTEPSTVLVMNEGKTVLIATPRVGYAVVSTSTGEVTQLESDRLFDQVFDSNDTIAVLYTALRRLVRLDVRTLQRDTIRSYTSSSYCSSASISQGGNIVTYFNSDPANIVGYDHQLRHDIDSVPLVAGMYSGNLTTSNDDCRVIVSSSCVGVVQWDACEHTPWNAQYESLPRVPTDVRTLSTNWTGVLRPMVHYGAGVLSVRMPWGALTHVTVVDQLGRVIAMGSAEPHEDGRCTMHLGTVSHGLYVACISGAGGVPFLVTD